MLPRNLKSIEIVYPNIFLTFIFGLGRDSEAVNLGYYFMLYQMTCLSALKCRINDNMSEY